jgi:hypothetical protein
MFVMDIASVAFDGIRRALDRADAAAERIAAGPPAPEDLVELSEAEVVMTASIEALTASEEMQKSLVDLLG